MLRLANNSAISSFAAPSLSRIGTDLNINRNWNLERLRMESLTSVGEDFLIFDNRTLPTCEAEAILEQLEDFSGRSVLTSNDPDGTCD